MDFTMPWGTYSYVRMPFGLMNVGTTFHRATDHAFNDMIGKKMTYYQDDLTIYSKLRELHLKHLR